MCLFGYLPDLKVFNKTTWHTKALFFPFHILIANLSQPVTWQRGKLKSAQWENNSRERHDWLKLTKQLIHLGVCVCVCVSVCSQGQKRWLTSKKTHRTPIIQQYFSSVLIMAPCSSLYPLTGHELRWLTVVWLHTHISAVSCSLFLLISHCKAIPQRCHLHHAASKSRVHLNGKWWRSGYNVKLYPWRHASTGLTANKVEVRWQKQVPGSLTYLDSRICLLFI